MPRLYGPAAAGAPPEISIWRTFCDPPFDRFHSESRAGLLTPGSVGGFLCPEPRLQRLTCSRPRSSRGLVRKPRTNPPPPSPGRALRICLSVLVRDARCDTRYL